MLKLMLRLSLGLILVQSCTDKTADMSVFRIASSNGSLVNEGYNRCIRYVNDWMNYADTITGLIPRNINESRNYWNAWDAAADNYPFMVLTSSLTMPEFFRTHAAEMLHTEERLTSRIGKLPDTYSFSEKGFRNDIADTSQIIFGSAEYMKDGLIPLTEWLGESPWSERMLGILDDLTSLTRVVKELPGSFYGGSAVAEVNGDLLQVLSRMYWFTGKREYLEWAAEIADHYLNETNLPTNLNGKLRIRDHGCEIISGLCEAYLAASYSWPEKREEWKPYIHSMLDRILEKGRNSDGLFYNEINPATGEIISDGVADTFGYTLNAYYFVYQLDSVAAYREAVLKGLGALNKNYVSYEWERGSADGYADAIEGALNLYNREQMTSVKDWIDSQIKVMWDMQKPSGIIEGWHGDGNFARTTIMYCLWKSQGLTAENWHQDLKIGAECKDGVLYASISCEPGWSGKIKFDIPRWRDKMHMPADYPRINQFQQWFTVEAGKSYDVTFYPSGKRKNYSGQQLIDGLTLKIKQQDEVFLTVKEQ
jgi:hypothetical protein